MPYTNGVHFSLIAVPRLSSATYTLRDTCHQLGAICRNTCTYPSPISSQFNLHLALVDVVQSEEKLPVEARLAKDVEIHHPNVFESGEPYVVLQQLTPFHSKSRRNNTHEHTMATKGIGRIIGRGQHTRYLLRCISSVMIHHKRTVSMLRKIRTRNILLQVQVYSWTSFVAESGGVARILQIENKTKDQNTTATMTSIALVTRFPSRISQKDRVQGRKIDILRFMWCQTLHGELNYHLSETDAAELV